MRLILALLLAGTGLVVGLACDVYGYRRRRSRVPLASPRHTMALSQPLLPAMAAAVPLQTPSETAQVVSAPHHEPSSPPMLSVVDGDVDADALRHAPTRRRAPLVGGLDGCRRGWVLVAAPADGVGECTVEVVTDVKDVLSLLDDGELLAVGIDIPIGLPSVGPRRCDVTARRCIGPRSGSVFPAPPRALLGAHSYEEASARSQALSGKGVSMQTFAIMPKVEAVDSVMTPDRQYSVIEVHPEVSFTLLAGHPMHFSKARPEGRAERLEALRHEFADVDRHLKRPPSGARLDDVLDAFAAAWSAQRWVTGTYERFGGELDGRGLRMEIIA